MLARGNLPRHPSAMMRRITEHADEEIHSPRTPSPELYPNGQRPSAAVRVPRRNAGGFDLAASLIRLTSTATLRPAQSLAARFKVVATGGSTSSLGALLRKDGEGAEGPWMPVHLSCTIFKLCQQNSRDLSTPHRSLRLHSTQPIPARSQAQERPCSSSTG